MTMQGIDISYWQKGNYQYLIDTFGKDFVIARAGFDKTVDSYCDKIYQYAKKKGKCLGFYFFPLSKKYSAKNHAQWAYDQVKNYIGESLPILDWESYSNHDASDVSWALAWLQEFERLSGVKPIIYMNTSCENSYNWNSVVANGNGLWIANYGINDGKNHGYGRIVHWKILAMHQYTSKGTSSGLDCDVFYGDKTAWNKYCKSSKQTTVETPKVETPKIEEKVETNEQIKETETDDQKESEPVTVCKDETPNWFITFIKKLAEFLTGLFK